MTGVSPWILISITVRTPAIKSSGHFIGKLSCGCRESITKTLAKSEFTYAADLGPDKETITYTLPGQSTFARVLDRRERHGLPQVIHTDALSLSGRIRQT
jgi:hypothetical protein